MSGSELVMNEYSFFFEGVNYAFKECHNWQENVVVKFWSPHVSIAFLRGQNPPACDVDMGSGTRWRLVYEVYQYFLPEGDLSEQSLISGMERVANIQNIQDNSRKVCEISLSLAGFLFLCNVNDQWHKVTKLHDNKTAKQTFAETHVIWI